MSDVSEFQSAPLNIPYGKPTLKDLLDAHKKDILLSLNCHAIATVVSFVPKDPVTGFATVTAQMNYSKTYTKQQEDGTYIQTFPPYPDLLDCPAITLGGGTSVLQVPVQPGDQCLILFNDRDLSNWWAGARSGPTASARLHSFTDAIALVGFVPWQITDTGHLMLTNGNAQVGVPSATVTGDSGRESTCSE